MEVPSREEAKHLQDILRLRTSTDLILIEVQEAILFLQEAVSRDRIIHQGLLILLQAVAADLHLHLAAEEVHILQDHPQVPHRVADLLQVVVAAVMGLQEEGSSLKHYSRVNIDHSKIRVQV